MRIVVDEAGFRRATARAGTGDADALWAALVVEGSGTSRSRVRDVAWYGGGLVTVLACAVFLASSWGTAGPAVGLAVAAVYGVGALLGAEVLRARRLPVPAALLALVVVALVPVAVVALRDLTTLVTPDGPASAGVAAWLREDVTLSALGALVLGGAARWRYDRAFLAVPPLLGGLWAAGSLASVLGAERTVVGLLVAGLLTAGALVDARGREADGWWLQLAGLVLLEVWLFEVLRVTGGTGAWVHGLGGAALVAAGVAAGRRLPLAAGGLGVFGALAYLASVVFADSLLFPLALAALGIAVVVAGVRLDAGTAR